MVSQRVDLDPGDSLIGAGQDRTFIRPAGVSQPLNGFASSSQTSTVPVTYARMDIGGFTAALSSTSCNNMCGTAILNFGSPHGGGVVIHDVRCHDNGTSCIAHGYGSVVADRIECDHNGYHPDSLLLDYRSSACIKLSEGSLVVRDSYIHDNAFDALWCDNCGNTHTLIEGNVIMHNGRSGVYWEVSGNFVQGDYALVRNNVIENNGWNCAPQGSQLAAGVTVEDAQNITIDGNTFGGNSACEELGVRAFKVWDSTTRSPSTANVVLSNNALQGDRIQYCTAPGVSCVGNAG